MSSSSFLLEYALHYDSFKGFFQIYSICKFLTQKNSFLSSIKTMLSFLSRRLHMGILHDKSSRRLNTSRQLLLSFICCIYLRRFITTRSKSTVFLQENVFADKQHCQYIHQRGDFLCFSADNINYYIRNNSNCNSFRDAVYQRHSDHAEISGNRLCGIVKVYI